MVKRQLKIIYLTRLSATNQKKPLDRRIKKKRRKIVPTKCHELSEACQQQQEQSADCSSNEVNDSQCSGKVLDAHEQQLADTSNETEFLYSLAEQLKFTSPQNSCKEMSSINEEEVQKSSLEKAVDRQIETLEKMDTQEGDNPQFMQVSAVLQMFQEIKQEIKNLGKSQAPTDTVNGPLQEDFKSKCVREISEAMNDIFEDEFKKMDKTKKEFEELTQKTGIITDVSQRMDVQIKEIDQRLEKLELGSTKRKVVLSGLSLVDKKSMIPYLQGFFEISMNIKVKVDDYFLVGTQEPKSVVVCFQTFQDKKLVLQNKRMLKDIKDQGRKLFINDYVPSATQEKRKRKSQVYDSAVQIFRETKVSFVKSNVVVNGKPYKKQVQPPTPSQLVNFDALQLDKLLKKKTAKGNEISKEGSKFVAYTDCVTNHKDIRDLYVKIKLLQPTARHIVCAYWVKHPEDYYALDYHDDDEHGAGRLLMEFLRVNNLKNRVVFVARRYGGTKLGGDRFQCYLDAATNVIENNLFNTILNEQQQVAIKDPRKVRGKKSQDAEWRDIENVENEPDAEEPQQSSQRSNDNVNFTFRKPLLQAAGPSAPSIRKPMTTTQHPYAYNQYAQQGELVPRFPHLQFSTPSYSNFKNFKY